MQAYNVLIVEDQRDAARMLQAGLRSLSHDFSVAEVPSGEEALLFSGRQKIDLLVIDINLPGMSGFELLAAFKRRQPDVKTILITGLTENTVRKRVANAGADAFFFKPLELADFLDATERVLGLKAPIPLPEETVAAEVQEEPQAPSLADRLVRLRRELKASSALILDDRGEPLVQAGELPESNVSSQLLRSILGVLSAGTRVSALIGTPSPESVLRFAGRQYDLTLSHLGPQHALLIVTKAGSQGLGPQEADTALKNAVRDLTDTLLALGTPPAVVEESPAPPPEALPPDHPADEQEAKDLEAILLQADAAALSPEDVAAFWDTEKEQANTGGLNPDDLSYDQARKLGLTPGEQGEE